MSNTKTQNTMYNIGENGHVQYTFLRSTHSFKELKMNPEAPKGGREQQNNLSEKVAQFEMQLNPNLKISSTALETMYRELLQTILLPENAGVQQGWLNYLYQRISYTRDIRHGKGLTTPSYMMIKTWHDTIGYGGEAALRSFVLPIYNEKDTPNGSWKDIKYFCDYAMKRGWTSQHPVIVYAIQLLNHQIRKDVETMGTLGPISWAAKWVPREKSKMNALFELLVQDYFAEYLCTSKTYESKTRAWNKAKMDYRKTISRLSAHLPILERNQCAGEWSTIDFEKMSPSAMLKQTKSLLNMNCTNDDPNDVVKQKDRETCAERFKEHIQKSSSLHSATIGVDQMVQMAIELIQTDDPIKRRYLNTLWKNHPPLTTRRCFIPWVDLSQSMDERCKCAAIGIALKFAEASTLGKGILTFSEAPRWVDLTSKLDFVDCIEAIEKDCLHLNTDIYSALDMVLNAMQDSGLTSEDVQDMSWIIISDMQIDSESQYMKPLHDVFYAKYVKNTGNQYNTKPNIVFWNVKTGTGTPCSFSSCSSWNPQSFFWADYFIR